MPIVNEWEFRKLFQEELGDSWERALAVFYQYGGRLSWNVANVLLHARDQAKVPEVLDILERYYEDTLQYQHPDIQGLVRDNLMGINPTQAMFLRVYAYTPGLQPTTAS